MDHTLFLNPILIFHRYLNALFFPPTMSSDEGDIEEGSLRAEANAARRAFTAAQPGTVKINRLQKFCFSSPLPRNNRVHVHSTVWS